MKHASWADHEGTSKCEAGAQGKGGSYRRDEVGVVLLEEVFKILDWMKSPKQGI